MRRKEKKIYVMERNHSAVTSALNVSALFLQSKNYISADEIKELPTYVTFARRLRLYGILEFRSNIGIIYKWKNMNFKPKNRD